MLCTHSPNINILFKVQNTTKKHLYGINTCNNCSNVFNPSNESLEFQSELIEEFNLYSLIDHKCNTDGYLVDNVNYGVGGRAEELAIQIEFMTIH